MAARRRVAEAVTVRLGSNRTREQLLLQLELDLESQALGARLRRS